MTWEEALYIIKSVELDAGIAGALPRVSPLRWGAWTKLEYLMEIIDGLGGTDNAMTFDR